MVTLYVLWFESWLYLSKWNLHVRSTSLLGNLYTSHQCPQFQPQWNPDIGSHRLPSCVRKCCPQRRIVALKQSDSQKSLLCLLARFFVFVKGCVLDLFGDWEIYNCDCSHSCCTPLGLRFSLRQVLTPVITVQRTARQSSRTGCHFSSGGIFRCARTTPGVKI